MRLSLETPLSFPHGDPPARPSGAGVVGTVSLSLQFPWPMLDSPGAPAQTVVAEHRRRLKTL